MNIFYLDHNTTLCAQYHVSRHCIKMILEYSQLLSMTHRVLDGEPQPSLTKSGRKSVSYILADTELNENLYHDRHISHPCSAWVRQSKENYMWLYDLCVKLMDEYTYRYGKVHASSKLLKYLRNPPKNISSEPFCEPPPSMPDEYKDKSSIISYHNYYNNGKRHLLDWKNRDVPYFINL
jgi:hypothetical protein